MQIILTDEEYLKLRPSALEKEFIQKVRTLLDPPEDSPLRGFDREQRWTELRDYMTRFDRESARDQRDETLLWPSPEPNVQPE